MFFISILDKRDFVSGLSTYVGRKFSQGKVIAQ